MSSLTVKNLGLENVDICGGDYVGAIVGGDDSVIISNCYVTGKISGKNYVGGLVGLTSYATLTDNYCSASINAEDYAGGIIGKYYVTTDVIERNFFSGTIVGKQYVGGLIGSVHDAYGDCVLQNNCSVANLTALNGAVGGIVGIVGVFDDTVLNLENCYFSGDINAPVANGLIGENNDVSGNFTTTNCVSTYSDTYATQMTAEEIAAAYTPEMMGFTEANGWTIVDGQPVLAFSMAARNANGGGGVLGGSNYITLQVGINADEYSQIGLDFGFSLDGVEALRNIGIDNSTAFVGMLDTMLETVSAKATEYGAAQNRLESALDEIAIQYDNLVSSRSTLRDADIAEVSSQYIQQQILQQASATLLATANQSPSIALQLI